MNKKILKIEHPKIRTYLRHAFPISIIENEAFSSGWIYEKYIQLEYHTENVANKYVCYKNYDFFVDDGVFIKGFHLLPFNTDFDKEYFINYIKDLIEKDSYFFGTWNEKYIKGKAYYQQRDFKHACFIYGYDDEKEVFCSEGYMTEHWQWKNHEISYNEFKEAVIPGLFYSNYIHFSDYKLNQDLLWTFSFDNMLSELKSYLDGGNENDISYGVNVTENYFNQVKEWCKNREWIVRTSVYIFLEHKNIMLERLKFISNVNNNKGLETAIKEYEKVVHNFQLILNYWSKYCITRKVDIGDRMYDLAMESLAEEIRVLKQLL